MADEFSSLFDAEQNFNQQNQPKTDDPFEMSSELSNYLQQMHGTESTHEKELSLNPISNEGVRNFMRNANTADINLPSDPFKAGQRMIGDFQNPNIPQQFLERYRIHPHYDDLGFNPFRDNETFYNDKSSTLDEIRRASGQWATLAGLGLKDALGFGEITDQDVARKYQEATALGQSSKGGVGGFITNTFLSSGYTAGIMGEMVLEEIGMALAEVGLGYLGAWSGGATAGAMGALAVRMGVRAERAMSSIAKTYKISASLLKTMDATKDIGKARKFYQAAAKVGNFVNPFGNTVDFLKNYDKFKDMDNLAKTAKGFGAFYFDIRNIRFAFAEGSMEGGFVQNEMQKSLYDEFVANNDRQPTLEEMNQMKVIAKQAGATTTLINTPMILLSNKMLFGGLMHGKLRGLTADIWKVAGKKVILNPKYGTKGVTKMFTEIPKGYFATKLAYIKNPKLLLTQGLKYASENISEGTQEVLQDVVSGAAKDYYKAAYEGDVSRGGYMNYVSKHLGNQMSAQGFETFASGFVMAGFIHPISTVVSSAMQGKEGYQNSLAGEIGGFIRDKATQVRYKNDKTGKWERYKEAQTKIKDEKERKFNEIVTGLDNFFSDPAKYLNPALVNLVEQKRYQEAMDEAIKSGDALEYHDVKDASLVKAVSSAVRMGHMNTFIERMDDMLKLSDEDLKESFPDRAPAEHRKVLQDSIVKAKSIQKRWDKYSTMRQNPFAPSKYLKGSPQYNIEVIKQIAWEEGVEQMVVNGWTFDQALARQNSILANIKNVSGLENTPYNELNTVFGMKSLTDEIEILEKTEIPSLETGIKDLKDASKSKALLEEKKKTLSLLKAFQKEILNTTDTDTTEDGSIKPENREKVAKALTDYINHIAGKNNDFVKKEMLAETINGVIDYWRLGYRATAANDAVNILLDPENFRNAHAAIYNVMSTLHNDRKAEIQKSIKLFMAAKDSNDMLNELFDEGVTIDPEDMINLKKALTALVEAGIVFEQEHIEALVREGKLPREFYSVDKDGNWTQEVIKKGAQYKKAIGILQTYIKGITGITISEEIAENYFTKAQGKKATDKRTYADLAAEFRFDPKAEETKVPLKKVLQTIIKSKHATTREKVLAEALLAIAKDDEFVTFSNKEAKAGAYSETRQSVIDARYSAEDYQYGEKANPIEFYILRQEIHRRTIDALKTDTVFAAKIDALLKEARTAFENPTPTQKAQLGDKPLAGLANAADFVDNAMTNEKFQTFLSKVKSQETGGKSPWGAFIDAVLENIKKIFSRIRPINNTVLNVALEVISTKIAGVEPMAPAATATSSTVKSTAEPQPAELVSVASSTISQAELEQAKKGNITDARVKAIAQKIIDKKELTVDEKTLYNNAKIRPKIDAIIKTQKRSIEAQKLYDEAYERIHSAESFKQLEDTITYITQNIRFQTIAHITSEQLEEWYNNKLADLTKNVQLEDIVEGSYILLHSNLEPGGIIAQVVGKAENSITVETSEEEENEVITKENFKKRVKMIHRTLEDAGKIIIPKNDVSIEDIKSDVASLSNQPDQKVIADIIAEVEKNPTIHERISIDEIDFTDIADNTEDNCYL